jgi:hypothetical protein
MKRVGGSMRNLAAIILVTFGACDVPSSTAVESRLARLDRFVRDATLVERGERGVKLTAPPEDVLRILREFRTERRVDHRELLLEYGLKYHWFCLRETRLARKLPVERDALLEDCLRLAAVPKYSSHAEAGWLDSQFYSAFAPEYAGWSSYQLYVRAKYRKCGGRIAELVRTIDGSGWNGLGGQGVCHYG